MQNSECAVLCLDLLFVCHMQYVNIIIIFHHS